MSLSVCSCRSVGGDAACCWCDCIVSSVSFSGESRSGDSDSLRMGDGSALRTVSSSAGEARISSCNWIMRSSFVVRTVSIPGLCRTGVGDGESSGIDSGPVPIGCQSCIANS